MSDMEDFSAQRQSFEGTESLEYHLKGIERSLDGQTYAKGEVPQANLLDPEALLPLNSDRLIGSVNVLEKLVTETMAFVESEITQVQKLQKKINQWEDRVEKNKALIHKNKDKIKQNELDIVHDKKNRDYWVSRAEQISLDYENAAAANREENWNWLIKKYGLKNPSGDALDATLAAIDELCNGEANNLISQYREVATKYDRGLKDKQTENVRMNRDIAVHLSTNETLQTYVGNCYSNEVEPLQDGILLLKELGVKLKALESQADSTYGDLRAWAEAFLNDFLKSNPKVPQEVVNEFRRLTSIPLPPTHS